MNRTRGSKLAAKEAIRPSLDTRAIERNPLQERAPIIEALKDYMGVTRFHMPGHRGGIGVDPIAIGQLGLKTYQCDVTGVLGMDDLHEPHGCIREAQELAAEVFGADQTYFSVGGTSGAVKAMVLATLNDGETLIIPRNIHKSILAAIVLSGAKPAFVRPSYDEYLGLTEGVELRSLEECVEANPNAKAALLVNPTYYGTAVDLTPTASFLHERGITLLVDEAHGPHFRFHKKLPVPALDSGADIVAQGAHKIIGALTQASFLHVKGARVDRARLKAMFQFLSSTSPSYLLLASLDAARRHMAMFGTDLIDYAINQANYLRYAVNQIPGLYSFGEESVGKPGAESLDPTKVTITVRELGISGYQAEKYLRRKHDIQVEMSDLYNVLIIVSYGNTTNDVEKLLSGLRDLVEAVEHGDLVQDLLANQKSIPDLPAFPEMALTPRRAVMSPWQRVSLAQARNRVSAEVVTCYPPGIPIVYPGEVITDETVAYLSVVKDLAFGISGPEDRTLETLRVVKDV
jgi:arginine/lysine/ornithine decarboxylase